MTEAQVNAFKLHFRPGKYGKFIEDKLPFREINLEESRFIEIEVKFHIEKRYQT